MSDVLLGIDPNSVQQYWEFFAATSTDESAADFVVRTRGKRYVVSGSESAPDVTLVDAPEMLTAAGVPTCARGWAAAYAWFAGEGAICYATGVMNVGAGLVCGGVFFALGMLPDFNAACKH